MNIQQEIQALKTKLAELEDRANKLTNPKWEPKGGCYTVTSYGGVVKKDDSDDDFRRFGAEFIDSFAADKACKAYRQYQRLYKLAEELNQGWEPYWDDHKQVKYVIRLNTKTGELYQDEFTFIKELYGIYFKTEDTAKKAIEIIEAGGIY